MQPSTFMTWVQETTFAGVPLWSLCVALAATTATYAAILVVLHLLTRRAKVWATQSHSGMALTMVDVLEGTSRTLMLVVGSARGREPAGPARPLGEPPEPAVVCGRGAANGPVGHACHWHWRAPLCGAALVQWHDAGQCLGHADVLGAAHAVVERWCCWPSCRMWA